MARKNSSVTKKITKKYSIISMLTKKITFEIFNNHFTKCVFAYPYSPMYPYSMLWSYRCGKSKQVVLLAHGRLSFLGRIESRGVLESPIMNFCFIFFVQFAIYFLFIVSDVVSEKTKFINSFNDNICVSGKSRAQCGQFCESTPPPCCSL